MLSLIVYYNGIFSSMREKQNLVIIFWLTEVTMAHSKVHNIPSDYNTAVILTVYFEFKA